MYIPKHTADITPLLDNLTVEGDLDLEHTSITHLPEGLTVDGYLDLSHTPITHLPEGLTVGGYLDLSHTPITHLPKELTVKGRIFPPNSLHHLCQLRQALTHSITLSGASSSAHDTLHWLRLLQPYPDVIRVWNSLPSEIDWRIDRA